MPILNSSYLREILTLRFFNLQEIYIEVHSFCIEFSHFREAGVLYRLLKNLEINETGSASPPSPPPQQTQSAQQAAASSSIQTQQSSRSGRSKKKESKK